MQRVPDQLHCAFAIFEQIAAPNARDTEAGGFQILGALGIKLRLFWLGMLRAV